MSDHETVSSVKPSAAMSSLWAWRDFGSELMLVTQTGGAQVVLCAGIPLKRTGGRMKAALATRDAETGLLRSIKPDDEVAVLIESAPRLRMALQGARQAIAEAPDDTWGYDSSGDPDVPGGRQMWTRKEEYLFHIDAVLGNRPTVEITELDLLWEKVNAMGGAVDRSKLDTLATGAALDICLKLIEDLGGSDPAPKRKEQERERQRGEKAPHR
jgi:hypothetical protein